MAETLSAFVQAVRFFNLCMFRTPALCLAQSHWQDLSAAIARFLVGFVRKVPAEQHRCAKAASSFICCNIPPARPSVEERAAWRAALGHGMFQDMLRAHGAQHFN